MDRVLVIDNDRVVRDSLTLTLEWAGYDVLGVDSPREGFAFHRENPASVVVADDIYIDHDRLEHIQALRTYSPTLPIIAISGTVPSTDQESDDLNNLLGHVYHLQKPFTVDEFLSTVKTALPHVSHS
ncbi:MAG: response regulator [Nitrospirales bacterium]